MGFAGTCCSPLYNASCKCAALFLVRQAIHVGGQHREADLFKQRPTTKEEGNC